MCVGLGIVYTRYDIALTADRRRKPEIDQLRGLFYDGPAITRFSSQATARQPNTLHPDALD